MARGVEGRGRLHAYRSPRPSPLKAPCAVNVAPPGRNAGGRGLLAAYSGCSVPPGWRFQRWLGEREVEMRGGVGIIGVIIIVLVILWLVGVIKL